MIPPLTQIFLVNVSLKGVKNVSVAGELWKIRIVEYIGEPEL